MPYRIDSKMPIHFENALLVSGKCFPLSKSAHELWPPSGACPALSQTATAGTPRSVLSEKLSVFCTAFPLCWTCHSPNADGRSKLCKSNAKGGNWLEHNCRSENATNQFLSPCFSFFICKVGKTIPIGRESKSWWLNENSILNWEFWTVLIYFNFPFCSSFLISTHLS